jgi:type IV fimbrial biogenesis protein FimT
VVSQDDPSGLCLSASSDTVAPRIIQKRSNSEVSGTMTIAADQSNIIFNGLGRATNIAGASAKVDISNPAAGLCAPAGSVRCLRVVVTQGGQVRMCDPALAAGTPQGC